MHAAAVGATPAEPSGPGAPAVKPPRIDAAPLWTAGAGETTPVDPAAEDTALRSLEAIELAGDAVVYTGLDREDDDVARLVVADARNGKERFLLLDGEGRRLSDTLPGRPRAIGGASPSSLRPRSFTVSATSGFRVSPSTASEAEGMARLHRRRAGLGVTATLRIGETTDGDGAQGGVSSLRARKRR
ncbi:hypothetical protein [Actinomadura sp. KC345]|uniref:hypothetical protein n=1 Tax=Actinomadura sp. KC345 TaxID=2530371 RepID=UPI00104FD302|nr:hypothetical protein [Actinomadura sp. KC345]